MTETSSLRIFEIEDQAGFLTFGAEWRRLFEATPDATPFQSWEWLSTWWSHFGRGRPLVLVALEGATPIGAIALTETHYRHTPLRLLQWMGAPHADYNDFVGGRRRDECATAFIRHLSGPSRWHVCDLSDLRAGTLASFSAQLGVGSCESRPSVTALLPPTRAEFDRSLSSKLRTSMKGRLRRLGDDHGPVEFCRVDSPADIPVAMEALFRLHTSRFARRGRAGAFADANVRAFHQEIAQRFLESGRLRLYQLSGAGRRIAMLYCFQHRDVVYNYLGGFDPELSSYGLGVLLLNHAIGDAIDSGAREFDFMRGAEPYKAQWNTVSRENGRLIFGRSGLASRLAVASRRAERRVSRFLQSYGAKEPAPRAPHTQPV